MVERLYDVLLPSVLLVWALFARTDARMLVACIVAFLVLSVGAHRLVVGTAARVYAWLTNRLAARRGDPPSQDTEDLVAPELLGPRAALTVVLASLGRYLGMWIYCVGVAQSIGLDIGVLEILAVTPLAQLSALMGFTPGGLGIQEVGWAGGLQLVGVGSAAIVVFIVAQRASFIASFAVLTVLAYPFRGRVQQGES